MKRIAFAVGLVVVLFAVVVLAQTAVQRVPARDWTPEQKMALDTFNNYIVASLKGNVDELMTFFHRDFIGWDYEQELPINYADMKKEDEEFYKAYKLRKFVVDPLEIQVENDLAVLHLNFEEAYSDSTGKETNTYGPWTVIMIKQNNRWVFLSFCWIEK